MIKNIERQKQLEEQKYLQSQSYKRDLSGSMPYCLKCDKATYNHNCKATQQERESQCLCAKSYNKLNKKK